MAAGEVGGTAAPPGGPRQHQVVGVLGLLGPNNLHRQDPSVLQDSSIDFVDFYNHLIFYIFTVRDSKFSPEKRKLISVFPLPILTPSSFRLLSLLFPPPFTPSVSARLAVRLG